MLDQKPKYIADSDFSGSILTNTGWLYFIDKVYIKKYPFGILREVRERVYSEFKPTGKGSHVEYKDRQQAVLKALNGTK